MPYTHWDARVDPYTSAQHFNSREVLCGYTHFQQLTTHTYTEFLQLQKGRAIWQALASGHPQSARKQVLTQTVGVW